MDYKELYTEALERARELSKTVTGANYEYIFPELKDDKDDRTKNEIIAFVEQSIHRGGGTPIPQEQENKWIAWLEKQGKPTHVELGQSGVTKTSDQELEPKFKVGDCVISNDGTHTYIVKERKRGAYVMLDIDDDEEFSIIIESADRSGRFWTIEDAKDGDVLVCPSDLGDRLVVFIFKQLVNHTSEIDCHCCIDANGIFDPCLNDCCYVGNVDCADYIPATKEQRDLLFQKMKEAGYEWDSQRRNCAKELI